MTDQRKPRTDHQAAAARLKASPQYEQPVMTSRSRESAQVKASLIRTGTLAAYQPAGAFQARWERSRDGIGWTVYACYVGDPTRREAA